MDQNRWYQMSINQVLKELESNQQQGLSEKVAAKRIERFGPNELKEKKKLSPIALFLNQFKDFMVLVLIGAVLISGLMGEYLDAITIIAIVVMNGILGFMQEFRAERSLRALKELSAPHAKVLRGGNVFEIAAKQLVPGDIVLLESGDRVPADLRLIACNSLYIEESALTGESVSVSKHSEPIHNLEAALGDQKNIGFMGTMVTKGTGTGVVIRTGMNTEMGRIADMIQNTESMETPLQRRLEQLGKILIAAALGITVLVVIAGILHGLPPYGMFLAGVSLAVAAIPEGLPAIVTIALAIGVQRMIRQKAVVRKLPSVETLGCASVICSDKTGTLTQNKMTVTQIWMQDKYMEVSGDGYAPHGDIKAGNAPADPRRDSVLRRLLHIAALCNNAEIYQETTPNIGKKRKHPSIEGGWKMKGDPTEAALVALAAKGGQSKESLAGLYEREREWPFDSQRKMMSVLLRHQGGRLLYVKGAPDMLLQRCRYILWEGKLKVLDDRMRKQVLDANEQMAGSALRVLGAAYREVKPHEALHDEQDAEQDLIFVGLYGMMDPPRQEVYEAILKCKEAGIRTVMITGDHQTTAAAIAKKIGILGNHGLVLNGRQLSAMSDEQLVRIVDDIRVCARVSPEHKLRIVKALQSKGHVVAMTGDGVNDAPAVKAADIGIAMGITGTDVTKEASSLILTDDNFATIVKAIEQGRGIYENIRKFIRYMLASNVGEILTMFIAVMLGMPLPLVPIMILWVNLVTDGLPAMALGVDQSEDDLMKQKPRPAKESVFARGLGWKIVSRGIMIGLCTLGAFWIVLRQDPGNAAVLTQAQTVAFATLVMAQLIHVFDCRSSKSIFHRNIFENKYLVLAVISSVILLLGVLYIEPLQPIFKTAALDLRDWAIVLVFAGIPTFVMGIGSVLQFPARRRNAFSAKPVSRT